MNGNEDVPDLTSDLDHWQVTLVTGEVVHLRAHGVREEADAKVFVALVKGSPAREYELVRFPSAAVEDVEGGWPQARA